jgi:cytochrome oxidase Cu insertion factor (SCO1/SenC/PrrC family)
MEENMRTLTRTLALALFLTATIAFRAGAEEGDKAEQANHPMIGEEAPLFSLESLDGETVELEELRGKLVVIHFGAGW